MARTSPITVGAITLACLVVVTALYMVLRSSDNQPVPAPPPAIEPGAPEAPLPSGSEAPAASRGHLPIKSLSVATDNSRPLRAPVSVFAKLGSLSRPATVDAAVPALTSVDAAAPTEALRKRDLAITEQRRRIIQAADEQVFESLALPESTRAAIRQLNETTAPGGTDEAERLRREGLDQLLGPDMVRQFTAAEFSAARRERRARRSELNPGQGAELPAAPHASDARCPVVGATPRTARAAAGTECRPAATHHWSVQGSWWQITILVESPA